MFPQLKKLLLFIRKIFTHQQVSAMEKELNDNPPCNDSAEGWDFVNDLNDAVAPPGSPAAATDDSCESAKRLSSLPPYAVIWTYFMANGYPAPEARRFYKRFQIFGWNSRIIPTLEQWPEVADHWMRQVRQSPKGNKTKPPADDTDTTSDNSHPGSV